MDRNDDDRDDAGTEVSRDDVEEPKDGEYVNDELVGVEDAGATDG